MGVTGAVTGPIPSVNVYSALSGEKEREGEREGGGRGEKKRGINKRINHNGYVHTCCTCTCTSVGDRLITFHMYQVLPHALGNVTATPARQTRCERQ